MLREVREIWGRLGAWLEEQAARKERAEFLPAALEIVDTPPSPVGRAVAHVIMAFVMAALIWSCIGAVDVIAVAPGKIVPTGRTKIIQPFETGVVRAIHVEDGQRVKAGDVLVEIDPTINEAEQSRLEADLARAGRDVARERAALAIVSEPGGDLTARAGTLVGESGVERQRLITAVEEILARLKGIDQQIAKSEANRAAVQSTIGKLRESLPLVSKRAEIRGYLASKGYGSKITALSTRQEVVEQQEELKVQGGRLEEATAEIDMLREQRRQAEAEFRSRTLAELSKAEQEVASLGQQVVQARQRHRLQTLTAPIDGTVQQLAIHTEGGVVTSAQAVMAIVPEESGLEIEASIANRDIGFVHAGQAAEIKIDTFNFTKYGLVEGSVQSVSSDAVVRAKGGAEGQAAAPASSSELPGQEYVYLARVSMARTTMQVDQREMRLAPGMAVTVEIKTGTRRVIEFLLSPLLRHRQQAFRER